MGLPVGRERSFPEALIEEINRRDAGVRADYVRLGEVTTHSPLREEAIKLSEALGYDMNTIEPAIRDGA